MSEQFNLQELKIIDVVKTVSINKDQISQNTEFVLNID
jgi:hypothetical protein